MSANFWFATAKLLHFFELRKNNTNKNYHFQKYRTLYLYISEILSNFAAIFVNMLGKCYISRNHASHRKAMSRVKVGHKQRDNHRGALSGGRPLTRYKQ